MKKFQFTLERMRDYKSQILDREKGVLKTLQQKKYEIEHGIAKMQQFRQEKSRELLEKQTRGISKQEMNIYHLYIENARLQIKQLQSEHRIAEVEVERQMKAVIKVSQEVSGLDRLEEKQQRVYKHAVAKEEERVISELLVSAGFRQRKD